MYCFLSSLKAKAAVHHAKDGAESFTHRNVDLPPPLLSSTPWFVRIDSSSSQCFSPFTLASKTPEPWALVDGVSPPHSVSGVMCRLGTLQNAAIMVIVASNTAQVWQGLMCSSPLPRSCGLCNSYTELGNEGCTPWLVDPSPLEHLLDLAALNGRTIQQHRTHVHVQFQQHIADCFQYPRSLVDVVTKEPCSSAIPDLGIKPYRRLRTLDHLVSLSCLAHAITCNEQQLFVTRQ